MFENKPQINWAGEIYWIRLRSTYDCNESVGDTT